MSLPTSVNKWMNRFTNTLNSPFIIKSLARRSDKDWRKIVSIKQTSIFISFMCNQINLITKQVVIKRLLALVWCCIYNPGEWSMLCQQWLLMYDTRWVVHIHSYYSTKGNKAMNPQNVKRVGGFSFQNRRGGDYINKHENKSTHFEIMANSYLLSATV